MCIFVFRSGSMQMWGVVVGDVLQLSMYCNGNVRDFVLHCAKQRGLQTPT